MTKHAQRNPELALVLAHPKVGNAANLAKLLGISRHAIYQWAMIPHHHVLELSRITGIPEYKLRPDLYRRRA